MANVMRSSPRKAWRGGLVVLAVLSSGAAFAQAAPQAGAHQPGLPTQLNYRSAIDAYRGHADQQVGSWREANDKVGRIGGWKAYAKEAQAAQSDATQGSAKDVTPDNPHAGHHGGGKP